MRELIKLINNYITSLDNLPPNLISFNCQNNPISIICQKMYRVEEVTKETIEKYNEIKRMEKEKECCPLLK